MESGPRICQSCGMPLVNPEDFGTMESREPALMYCKYCYQQGKFTEHNVTIKALAARGAKILSDMYQIPIDKAEAFSSQHLQYLKRWTDKEVNFCESCGMPLVNPGDAGTESDGSDSTCYCCHCYQKGQFTHPNMTREEMIERYAPIMAAQMGMPVESAKEMVSAFTSTLPRWN